MVFVYYCLGHGKHVHKRHFKGVLRKPTEDIYTHFAHHKLEEEGCEVYICGSTFLQAKRALAKVRSHVHVCT